MHKNTTKTSILQTPMLHNTKVEALIALGEFLQQAKNQQWIQKEDVWGNEHFFQKMESTISQARNYNPWFTKEQVLFALESWGEALQSNNIQTWLKNYALPTKNPKNIGLILAGNIPMVGLHDVLCVWLSGHSLQAKLSSQDKFLIPLMVDFLQSYTNEKSVKWVERLQDFDATIATGSNNSARYFEYYFGKVPHIIRKNRNSVAVLNGNETEDDLQKLGIDIFTYFGLGCRNVNKLFVPKGYDFHAFFQAIFPFNEVIYDDKYANNYDYNKAVFLMSNEKLLDNGFITLKEDTRYASPISSVFYEFYDSVEQIQHRLKADQEQIQCVVSSFLPNSIAFGETQKPALWDYADGMDTMQFLLNL